MRKILTIGVCAALSACSAVPALHFAQQPPPPAPAIPVFFQPFSAKLDGPALQTIATVAQAAAAQPQDRVIVSGAADNVGSPQANKYMSETRAQMVADQLTADGVPPHRIKIRALGTVPNLAGPGQPAQAARRVLIQLRA